MPRIGKEILDAAFYLYGSEEEARAGQNMGGTGFLVSYIHTHEVNRDPYVYAVTNWHVAVRDGFSVVRLNCHDGTTDTFDFDPSEWQFIPGGPDVAAVRIAPDPLKHKSAAIPLSSFVSRNRHPYDLEVDTGEDVFMVGRFMDHDGGEVNVPAVRFGNISVMPTLMQVGELTHPQQYYCIDMHSRTGFSGSLVVAYRTLGSDLSGKDARILYDEVVNAVKRGMTPDLWPYWGLLGIHCGQFMEQMELKADKETARKYVIGMSGMTLVAPAWDIEDTLNLPKLQEERCALDADKAAARKKLYLSAQKPKNGQ